MYTHPAITKHRKPRRQHLAYIRGTTSMMVNEASPVTTSSVLPLGFKYVSGCNRYTGGRGEACE